jgi:tetratricopeptide (TPR) repeat protein
MHCTDTAITLHFLQAGLPIDNEAERYYLRGTARFCVGRYSEAVEWFDRALNRSL